MTTRLIERWLPIADLGIESVRERTPMTPYPAPNRLHVWWARRPLVASRAAILASILHEDADRNDFKYALGIHGDPVQSRARIERSKRTGQRFEGEAYSYKRAFTFTPSADRLASLLGNYANAVIVDPTAGGGAIPLEAVRCGMTTFANDLNPVASLLLRATIDLPRKYGHELEREYKDLVGRFLARRKKDLESLYPPEPVQDCVPTNYLWCRTITCPYCEGRLPLSPNWRLTGTGKGIKLLPFLGSGPGDRNRKCGFEMVEATADQSPGTVSGGNALCPYSDCDRAVPAEELRRQAQVGEMGDQMFAVIFKRKQITSGKGKKTVKWERGYRAVCPTDDNTSVVARYLDERMAKWEALDILPTERIGELHPKWDIKIWGMTRWTDMFSSRQLAAHCISVETFKLLVEEDEKASRLNDLRRSAFIYLAIAMDKSLDWNSRQCTWELGKLRMAHTFAQHAFAFKWSYAEMAMILEDGGVDWATSATGKALKELVAMLAQDKRGDLLDVASGQRGSITISNGSGASLTHLANNSVDAIIIDPPYGANVMYAQLSDFFYVWLKRTAGLVAPDLFTRALADKDAEAVANVSLFKGQKGAARLADSDYRFKMEGIFAECRRILKDDGIMTVMFTHKDTGAWDALAMSLMDAGFVITASWPVNTEASGSLHIKDKAAANSTIFLVCRPRQEQGGEASYWEEVEPLVAKAVRERIDDFQRSGIAGVDLYLASFGPALEAFSRHWPLTRGTPAPQPPAKRGVQVDLLEVFDPYAVRPEDALNAARREVKAWRLAQLADRRASRDMDPATAWVALAWDAFRAPQFAFDEGLRLARAVGLDMAQVVGRLAEKKNSDLKLWDSATRLAKGALGPPNGSRGMIDALHHAANIARKQSVEAARDHLLANGLLNDDEFKVALEVTLEVLPPSKTFSGIDADDAVKPAADDFDALEKLRRIVYGDEIGAPRQLDLYADLDAA